MEMEVGVIGEWARDDYCIEVVLIVLEFIVQILFFDGGVGVVVIGRYLQLEVFVSVVYIDWEVVEIDCEFVVSGQVQVICGEYGGIGVVLQSQVNRFGIRVVVVVVVIVVVIILDIKIGFKVFVVECEVGVIVIVFVWCIIGVVVVYVSFIIILDVIIVGWGGIVIVCVEVGVFGRCKSIIGGQGVIQFIVQVVGVIVVSIVDIIIVRIKDGKGIIVI